MEDNSGDKHRNAINMRFDMRGRLNKISFVTNPLLPVFEAVVNSIHAIEDGKVTRGKIIVRVIRKSTPLFCCKSDDNKKEKHELLPIVGFEIEDNGVGFTDENFNHFLTTDTTHKINRGGRGVGRLSWLKAFGNVFVDSSYRGKDGERKSRAFTLVASPGTNDFIFNQESNLGQESSNRTIVKLEDYKREYQERCPKKAATIALKIIDHCIDYFLSGDCPEITLIDEDSDESIILNNHFKDAVLSTVTETQFQIDDSDFVVKHLRLAANYGDQHVLFYSANRRTVKSDDLAKFIPNLSSKLFGCDSDDEKFVYIAYVESPFFDVKVNEDRNDFSIPLDDDLFGELNWKHIRSKIIDECQNYITPYTEHIEKKKRERIDRFVSEQAPQYRPILKYAEKEIASVSPDIDDDKLDMELYGVYQSVQKQVRAEGCTIFSQQLSSNDSVDGYEGKIQAYIEKITDINKSDLARYVCHRKVVLNYLQECLRRRDDGKYNLESDIHSAIFPMISISDDIPFSGHNLWVLDEKLVYHSFLASDKPIASYMDTKNTKEPDLAIFNAYEKACAFSNSPEGEAIASVVIIEFKRPMRDQYGKEDSPIAQVYGYVDEIRKGKKTTYPTGRPIAVAPTTPFYCYIVCDITDKIKRWATEAGFINTPDGQGYFFFNQNYNAYVEIMSFDKMLSDARKRQLAFFEKLNLPSHAQDR